MSLPETQSEQSRWVFKRALAVTAVRAFAFNAISICLTAQACQAKLGCERKVVNSALAGPFFLLIVVYAEIVR